MDTSTAIWIGFTAGAVTFGWFLPWLKDKFD